MFRLIRGLLAALWFSAAGAQELTPQFPPGVFDVLAATSGTSFVACTSTCLTSPEFVTAVNPQATVTNYIPANGTSVTWNASLPVRESIWPITGTASNLQVILPTAVATNYYTISLNVGGTSTALQCSVGQGGTNLGTTTTCTDSTDVVNITAGQLVAIQSSVPGGTPTTLSGRTNLSWTFTSTVGQESPITVDAFVPSTAAINYQGPNPTPQTTDALASWVMPAAGVLDRLYVGLSGAAGAGKSWQFNVFQNGVATSLLAGGTTSACGGASSLTCSDLASGHAITVAVGDTISIQVCPSATSGCPAGSAPAALSAATLGLRWVPTTTNEAVLIGVSSTVPPVTATSNYFGLVSGSPTYSVTETVQSNIAPVLAVHMTLGGLYVAQCPGPDTTTGTVTRAVTLRAAGASQTPTVTVATGTTACPTLSTIQDTTHTYAATSAQQLDLLTAINSTTNAATVTEFKTSMWVTVP